MAERPAASGPGAGQPAGGGGDAPAPADALAPLRAQVDAIDAQLVRLLGERAQLARSIGHLKGTGPVYRPEREAQVLDRLTAANPGPLPDAHLRQVFIEIMGACRALEAPLTVTYLGPPGTYSEEAVVRQFGTLVERKACATFDDVFREVEAGAAHYGVVPVENSTEGAVGRTLDLLLATPLNVTGEVLLPIHHCLMGGTPDLAAITRVYSHSQSLGQCVRWLNQNLPRAERVPVVSNAEAARLCAGEPHSAAIAGRAAAGHYALPILAENIEDEPDNTTRFLVIGRDQVAASGRDKMSLALAAQNRPGAVYQLLEPLAANGVSMTRFESRPARNGRWEYMFFVDIEGHPSQPHVERALVQLEARAMFIKRLGAYPAARG
jgi:chorismate mutase / prephenate dehydratase